MKKFLCCVAALVLAAGLMAQTPEEKEAAKAAKKEAAAKQKAANALVSAAIEYDTQIQTLNAEIRAEQAKGNNSNDRLIVENQEKLDKLSAEGLDKANEALATGLIPEKKLFEVYRAKEYMSKMVFNKQIQLIQNDKESSDLNMYAKGVYGVCDSYHGEIVYGNKKDDTQLVFIKNAELNLSTFNIYFAHLCQLYIMDKKLDEACKALDAYVNYAKSYPEVADAEGVKNPREPFAKLAFNVYYTAYTVKNYDVMAKYYDLALQFEDEASRNFVIGSRAQILKQSGKTDEWIAELKKIISENANNDAGENAMQQLMGYYSQKENKDEVNAYTSDLIAKYPDNKTANYCHGFAMYSAKNYPEAIKFFQKAGELDPSYLDAFYNCGYCWYEMGLDKARAVSGKSMRTQAQVNAAEAEVKKCFKNALPYFEKVRDAEPEKPERWARPLQTIYKNTGNAAGAKEMEQYVQ
ncbi:MAG: hypothetical protein IKM92_05535 [Bacteroidaceae bacterium]|nr:hypothetical protein [Bacteroidaceae bacterium]